MDILGRVPVEVWIGVAAFAGYALWVMLSPLLSKRRTRGWPVAEGRVIEAAVKDEFGVAVTVWRVRLAYAYEAGGAEHQGRYEFTCATGPLAEEAVASLRDAAVCVHYDPRRPERSLLWESEVWRLY